MANPARVTELGSILNLMATATALTGAKPPINRKLDSHAGVIGGRRR
jgi:hypothetical protein